ncbi:MAG: 50S ribosomal protein L6 [Actinobacteria bacterium ATB1]|nr:50S ribosomal protein L6 [Actinobacteria bacterium ATB1]
MSRVGNSPIDIPSGVEVKIERSRVSVKGPKGSLETDLPDLVEVNREGDVIVVTRPNDQPQYRAMHGLVRSLVNNMVVGVTDGFQKELDIIGVGYRAQMKGKDLEIQVGYSHPVVVECPQGIEFEVPQPTRIVVRGTDKQQVGQVAADIRKIRKPEPYKGKGIRYVDEHVRRKAGKTGAV